jgi:hypothetical protein
MNQVTAAPSLAALDESCLRLAGAVGQVRSMYHAGNVRQAPSTSVSEGKAAQSHWMASETGFANDLQELWGR